MLSLLVITYTTVFFAELLGDKSVYAISSLTMRFRALPVFCGLTAAFMGKMLAAVLMGQALSNLPAALIAGTSAATFFITAAIIWFKRGEDESPRREGNHSSTRAAMIAFGAIFFAEWADIGQLTAAALTAQYDRPLVIWLGATLALMTKGLLAMTLGVGVRRYTPKKVLRYVSFALCLTMGLFSVAHLWV